MIGGGDSNRALRWAVIAVLGAATAGVVAVSLRANYLFGFGFGQSPETAQVFGWANVATDLWKVSGLILIGSLWRTRRWRLATLLFPIWAMCLLWGMAGAIGVYAQDRSTLVGGRRDAAASYAEAERELRGIEATLATLTRRTVQQVDAAIAAVLARPVRVSERVRRTVGAVSNNCMRDDRATADACLEVARLREERTAAKEAERLHVRAAELHALTEKLRRSGGTLPADPAADLIAWLSGGQLNVHDIGFGFPLVFATLIELISAFGPAGIAAYAEATRKTPIGEDAAPEPAMARSGAHAPTMASLGALERVVCWMAERTEPTNVVGSISIEILHADYVSWCIGHDLVADDCADFQRAFDRVRETPEITESIRKFGSRYYGIRLLPAPSVSRLRTS